MKKKPFWYRVYLPVVKALLTKKSDVVCLEGRPVKGPSIMISNHEGASGPISLEYYLKVPKRFWSAHEMLEGLGSVHRYLAYYYFPEKKHFSRFFSRAIGTIAAPFVNLFYKGLDPILTYSEGNRLISTLRESESSLNEGDTIIVFPEDSSKGYSDKPETFLNGFAVLLERMYKKGHDLYVYVAHFSKKKRRILIDKPVLYSMLRETLKKREEIVESLRLRMHELADV